MNEKKEYRKKYYELNKERENNSSKLYYENNKDLFKEKAKKYKLLNKDRLRKYNAEYRIKNKEKINESNKSYQQINRTIDPLFKLKGNLRNLIKNNLTKQGYSKKSKTYQILGCSYEEFRLYIESQFTEGMSWDNYGQWHLDHIKPISLAANEQEAHDLNHYTNFQPLWSKDNLKKGNKYIGKHNIK